MIGCGCRIEKDGDWLRHYACKDHVAERIEESGGVAMFQPLREIQQQFSPSMIGVTPVCWNVIEGDRFESDADTHHTKIGEQV